MLCESNREQPILIVVITGKGICLQKQEQSFLEVEQNQERNS